MAFRERQIHCRMFPLSLQRKTVLSAPIGGCETNVLRKCFGIRRNDKGG